MTAQERGTSVLGSCPSLIARCIFYTTRTVKKAVNSVFTHGSFHWIKARGCCVSLRSHHYAWWILMSATHWGDLLKRNEAGPRFQYCFSFCVLSWPSACRQEYTVMHSYTNAYIELLIKTCMNSRMGTHTHIFIPQWMIKVLEGKV